MSYRPTSIRLNYLSDIIISRQINLGIVQWHVCNIEKYYGNLFTTRLWLFAVNALHKLLNIYFLTNVLTALTIINFTC